MAFTRLPITSFFKKAPVGTNYAQIEVLIRPPPPRAFRVKEQNKLTIFRPAPWARLTASLFTFCGGAGLILLKKRRGDRSMGAF